MGRRKERKIKKKLTPAEKRALKREARAAVIARRRLEEEEKERAKVSRAKKRAGARKITIIVLVVIITAVGILGGTVLNTFSLMREKSRLEEEQAELTMTKERLEQELANVSSPEYIEQQARSHLRLIKPGEILYIRSDDESAVGAESDEN